MNEKLLMINTDCSVGGVPDYNAPGTGFAPSTCRPLLGSPSLNGYWDKTGNRTMADKRAGHPTTECRKPSVLSVVTYPLATPI